jgi:hypothetical protein
MCENYFIYSCWQLIGSVFITYKTFVGILTLYGRVFYQGRNCFTIAFIDYGLFVNDKNHMKAKMSPMLWLKVMEGWEPT